MCLTKENVLYETHKFDLLPLFTNIKPTLPRITHSESSFCIAGFCVDKFVAATLFRTHITVFKSDTFF